MQITINVPDNLPPTIIKHYIDELEEKLKQQANTTVQAASKWKKMVQRIEKNTFDLGDYTETFNQSRQDFRQSLNFKDNQ